MFDANGKPGLEPEARAAARVLALFASPLNLAIMRALAKRPMRLAELQAAVGSAPQTTLRGHLKNLIEVGTVERRHRRGSATAVDHELTLLGLELLEVADVLERWLALAPEGPIALDSERGRRAVKSLAGGWVSTLLRALASHPLSLAELDVLIDDYSYPALERRLSKMRAIGQVETVPSSGARTLYTVTDWARRAIAPLAVAGRCERRHIAETTAPVTHIEAEAAFRLALPLVALPREMSGVCALAVDTGLDDDRHRVAGVRVEVENGRILTLSDDFGEAPPSWCMGSPAAWMNAVIDGGADRLRIGGSNRRLAWGLVSGLHTTLFPR